MPRSGASITNVSWNDLNRQPVKPSFEHSGQLPGRPLDTKVSTDTFVQWFRACPSG
jgi:hypothetical protein